MITKGLTNNDLKVIEMDLDELKHYQDSLLDELSDLNGVLEAIREDPGMVLSETISRRCVLKAKEVKKYRAYFDWLFVTKSRVFFVNLWIVKSIK